MDNRRKHIVTQHKLRIQKGKSEGLYQSPLAGIGAHYVSPTTGRSVCYESKTGFSADILPNVQESRLYSA